MWILVPVKRFTTGKSRLARVLSTAERAELTRLMLEDVLRAVRQAQVTEGIIVLSSEASLNDSLVGTGVMVYHDTEQGDFNSRLTAACAAMLPSSADRVLILPADIPTVSSGDIDVLAQMHANAGGVALVPAAVDGGTNALVGGLPLPIRLQFGESSLLRHVEGARRHGVDVQVVARHRLERDIDRPEDLEWLAESPYACGTRTYVRRVLSTPIGA